MSTALNETTTAQGQNSKAKKSKSMFPVTTADGHGSKVQATRSPIFMDENDTQRFWCLLTARGIKDQDAVREALNLWAEEQVKNGVEPVNPDSLVFA